MLFKKIISVYSENRTNHINTLYGQNVELLIKKADDKNSYHWTPRRTDNTKIMEILSFP
jgi:hypothetical protein